MLAKLGTFALVGIEALPVEVEVDNADGQVKIILVGLPEMAVKESTHRIERALFNLGYGRPRGRTVITLAPADLKKDAGAFDLLIALGMLIATGQVLSEQVQDYVTVGELALDGSVRPNKGALALARAVADRTVPRMLVPAATAREAAVVEEVAVYSVSTLAEAVGIVTFTPNLRELLNKSTASALREMMLDLAKKSKRSTSVHGRLRPDAPATRRLLRTHQIEVPLL